MRNTAKNKGVMMKEIVSRIQPAENQVLRQEIQSHLDDLTKPLGSLGRLEEIAMQYCLCRNTSRPEEPVMKVFTFAGDHGITEENITPYPKEVTKQMVLNMLGGGAAASVMCKTAGIGHFVVDMGVDADFDGISGLVDCKTGRGTRNFTIEPAMSAESCESAMQKAADIVVNSGASLVGIGEMGIGNSSSASAIYSLILDVAPLYTVGAGTGSLGDTFKRKLNAVCRGVELHRNEWDKTAFDALRRTGGFEIAGMAGAILGAASARIPVVVDGFIAGAAGLVASRISPAAKDYIFYSHASAENFHMEFLAREKIKPILSLDMRLGEGTGAILAMQIINQAIACYNKMATFSSAGVAGKNGC
jgi:nicotinate-nucleotide--dimethylbenzimidazole phosphoribosyltransferase